ncbi:mitoguardin 2-like isoform X2 [Engraulis encrasicolus]|uniref:mitoguardin 2-like isoform X2 n=1 Tax=Engraulis encrasicolus TaxID=184585 RepID=UPI002FCEB32C
MPSSAIPEDCKPCSEDGQRKEQKPVGAHTLVSRERPVLQAVQRVILRGLRVVFQALSGPAELTGEGAVKSSRPGSPDDTGVDRMFYSCHENVEEDLSWAEERQPSGTDLTASTPKRHVYFPESELDVLIDVKLQAVRQAFQIIIQEAESMHFLKEAALSVLTGLLQLAGKKTEGFTHVWNKLMVFAESPSNGACIAKECQEAGMQTACFYDLFYEAIVLRLLECGEQAPLVLRTTLRTPWISGSTKKTAVMFHAWAQIRRERELLMRPQGLFYHLCEVRDYVDGEIMWAAFGPQSDAKDFYFLLRGELLSFVQYIFSLDSQCYSSSSMLAVLIFSALRGSVCRLQEDLMKRQRATGIQQASQNHT